MSRILLIEDDDATRGLVELVLREEGYAVEQASDGLDALELIGRVSPDLILLDKQLPRMNGTEFAAAYRALEGDHAPIVALCAGIDCTDWGSTIGAAAVLMKPFGIDQLSALVRTTLSLHRVAPPATPPAVAPR